MRFHNLHSTNSEYRIDSATVAPFYLHIIFH